MPGSKCSFYLTGTTTSTPVYSDSGLTTPHTQPVVADSAGILPVIYLDPTIVYKVTITTSADVLYYTIDPVNDQVLSASVIGSILYPRTAAEIAASVTPVDYAYPPGDSRRQSITNDSSTDHTTAFQALLNGAAGADQVHVYKTASSGYIKLTGRITAPANTHIVLHDGVELKWTTTAATGTNLFDVASRPGIEITGDNFRLEGKGCITGPDGTPVTNEAGILAIGTSTSVRKSGLRIDGQVEIKNWGAYGVVCQFVDNIDIFGATVHYCGSQGMGFLSCNHGCIQRCKVYNITDGAAGEVWGISLTHDSRDYDLDANAGTNGRLTAHPFCIDWDISSNILYDITSWTAIDAHGCYETHVHHNKTYNCRRGIQIASSSGDAIAYAGESNSVCFNSITSRKIDGSATSVSGTSIDGITVNGGATIMQRGVRVIGNDIEGCGSSDNNSGSITCAKVREAVVMGNTIRNWAGYGIYTFDGDGIMLGNMFGAVSNATTSRCIRIDTSSSGSWQITSNRHCPQSGTAASEGLRVSTTTFKHTVENNDFDAATTPYIGGVQTLSGAGAITLVDKRTLLTTTGANALTLANGTDGQVKEIVMVADGGDGTLTPTTLRQFTTITFNDVGDSVTLKWVAGKWQVMANQGCTLA